jgi:hypothetical protein
MNKMTEQKAKIRKSLNYLIRVVIIIVTYGFIYRQVFVEHKLQDIPGMFSRITEQQQYLALMILTFILMLINWGIESYKWKLLIAKIEKISFIRAFRAVMTGVSVSLFTPNRTGDYLGRVFILEKGNHLEGIFLTLIGSFAQIVVTFSIGLFSLLAFADQYLRPSYQFQQYILTSLVVFIPCLVFGILFLYFNLGILSDFISRFLPRKWEHFKQYVLVFAKFSNIELFRILLLSILRYLVFSSQFFLLLIIFGADLPALQGLVLIPVIYLAMSLVPTLALTELGIRGSVSVFIIGLYFERYGSGNADTELAILTSSTLLWLINLIIPAIMGTFFVFSLKFFRK